MSLPPFCVGAVFPQTDIEQDPAAIRDFAQAIEALGYSHLIAYDHIVGANPAKRPGERLPYTHESTFIEPLVLFSHLAGLTQHIGFMSGVVIMPQRQTVLFAKQAANVDVLSGGRLRLGLGTGYIPYEYAALGMDFHKRGKRFDEQIPFLRRIWTEPLLDARCGEEAVCDAAINPLPVQRPIPLFIGGRVEAALRRAARVGDGYLAVLTLEQADQTLGALASELDAIGRDPAQVPIENIVVLGDTMGNPVRGVADAVRDVAYWQNRGIAGAHIHTMGMGIKGVSRQLALFTEVARALGLTR
jgi:probable F420-dependent oxidoreductase